MLHLIVSWLISAAALWIVAQVVPGIRLKNFGTALLAAVIIAVVNGTVGVVLKIVTIPLTIVTLGLFLLVVNAFLLKVAAAITPNFRIDGCLPAILGSLALTILNTVLRYVVFS
jgi:putative membrane protein